MNENRSMQYLSNAAHTLDKHRASKKETHLSAELLEVFHYHKLISTCCQIKNSTVSLSLSLSRAVFSLKSIQSPS